MWHEAYSDRDSALARRLSVAQRYIGEALATRAPGAIRVVSMCAGDGRDILGVLSSHPRACDVTARLVELNPELARRSQAAAPSGVDVLCGDAGLSDSYLGAVPADLVLACGIFGNVSRRDIRNTINSWRMLCRQGAVVIWTRGGSSPDLRNAVRAWVSEAGFEEVAFEGPPETYGVGMARMVREPLPLALGIRFFEFVPEKAQPGVSV